VEQEYKNMRRDNNLNKKAGIMAIVLSAIFIVLSFSGCVEEGNGKVEMKNPDTMVYYTFGDAKTLDPADAYDSASAEAVFSIYEGLITYKGDNLDNFYPSLATSWSVSEDSKTWTFYLREGVKFSNGNDFTAEDVKYSFDRVLKMNSPESGVSWILSQSIDENSTKVIDDYTIEINLIEPYGGFLSTIAYTVGFIVDKDYVEEHGGVVVDTENEYLKLNPMGTGPYMLDHWTRNTEMVLVKNPNYWGGWEGKHVDKVVIKYANEAATRILALKNGDADIAVIPNENLVDLEDDKGIIVIPYDSFDVVLGCFNTESTNIYLADPEVRKAFSHIFNYQSAIDDAYVGYMSRLAGCIPNGMPYYDTQNGGVPVYDYDLDEAAKILDAAGYTLNEDDQRFDGTTFRLFYNAGNTERQKMSLSFQEELDKLGIVSSVTAENWPQFLHRMYSTDDWDFICVGWGPDYNDPDDYINPFVGSDDITHPAYNTGYKNETVDEMILKGKYTTVSSEREDAYKTAFDIYIQEPPFIFIGQRQFIRPKRDWVKGYYYNPVRDWYWYDYYKE
jgi:peptide/nickel transport system substrate-binding protein